MQACYSMLHLFCLLAKLVHNLALRVLQQNYAELCEALSRSPEEVAAVLYSNGLMSRDARSRLDESLGLTKLEKAGILVQAFLLNFQHENSSAPLKKFCQLLSRYQGVGSIVSRMKFRLGEWMIQLYCD